MFAGTSQLLGLAATAYGVLAALAALLQTRQMLARRASCDVSARFFAAYAGGYAIWLLYGLSVGSVPLIVVDAVGLLCGGLTLAVALSLRGSLLGPRSWASCDLLRTSTPDGPSSAPAQAASGTLHGRRRRESSTLRLPGSSPW
jgi:MtN3 and saliva related transmembrane protein